MENVITIVHYEINHWIKKNVSIFLVECGFPSPQRRAISPSGKKAKF